MPNIHVDILEYRIQVVKCEMKNWNVIVVKCETKKNEPTIQGKRSRRWTESEATDN